MLKKVVRIAACLMAAAISIVSQTGCAGKEPVSATEFLLNTVCSITIYDEGSQKEREELIRQAFALSKEYEDRMSRTLAGSDINRLNKAEGKAVEVDPETAEVIREGVRYGELSGGLFDITVGGLTELWNFTGENPSVPSAEALAEAVAHVGYQKISVLPAEGDRGPWVRLSDPKTKLDLGGIAKGYIAGQAAEYLRARGVKSAILNYGGNITCIGGRAQGKPFRIGIEKPFSQDGGEAKAILGTIEVSDMSVVTSGTYDRKFYEDGRLYYHILDPAAGYPKETDLDGVTIVGKSSADCDGLSTVSLMLGLEKGKAFIESLEGYEAIFVAKDGRIAVTDGLADNFKPVE